jgi:branched-chain amino acid transport system substrate-binding protein
MKKVQCLGMNLFIGLFVLIFFSTGAAAKEVTIGFTGPLSGPAAQYGRDNVAGLEMGIKDVNEAGGITINGEKYTFRLRTLDDHIDPTAAVNNARRLRDRQGVKFIYNPVFNTIAPMMVINQQPGGEFLMMAYTSTPGVDEIDNELAMAIPPPFSAYLQAFSEVAWEKGWRRGAMLVTLGAYGDDWRGAFRNHWTGIGGEIVADHPANYYAETDFSSHLSSVLARNPDFILIGGPSDPTALVIEQARGMGFNGGFLLVDQAKLNYIEHQVFNGDRTLLENTVGVARTLNIGPYEVMEAFHKRYRDEYGMESTSEIVLNYASIRMLAKAMEHAQSVDDLQAIKAAHNEILPMEPEENLVAYMGIDGTRMLIPASIQYIENGEYADAIASIWWIQDEDEFHLQAISK